MPHPIGTPLEKLAPTIGRAVGSALQKLGDKVEDPLTSLMQDILGPVTETLVKAGDWIKDALPSYEDDGDTKAPGTDPEGSGFGTMGNGYTGDLSGPGIDTGYQNDFAGVDDPASSGYAGDVDTMSDASHDSSDDNGSGDMGGGFGDMGDGYGGDIE